MKKHFIQGRERLEGAGGGKVMMMSRVAKMKNPLEGVANCNMHSGAIEGKIQLSVNKM